MAGHLARLDAEMSALFVGLCGAPQQAHLLVARLAAMKGLARSHLSQLRTALPKLMPDSAAAAAVAARVESARGRVLRTEPKQVELEADLEHGADPKRWLVYADALTAKGDLRGELVVLASQGKETRPYVEKHADALLGDLPELLEKDLAPFLDALVWRQGFIESATLRLSYERRDEVTMERLVGALLSCPAARFLAELKVGLVSHDAEENDCQEVVATLGQSPFATRLLRTLGLVNTAFVHELIPALAQSSVLKGLEELDLSLGALHDGDVDLLVQHAAAFAHLKRIDLGRNQFDARQAELQQAWPMATFGEQRHWSDYGADEPGRYVAVGE